MLFDFWNKYGAAVIFVVICIVAVNYKSIQQEQRRSERVKRQKIVSKDVLHETLDHAIRLELIKADLLRVLGSEDEGVLDNTEALRSLHYECQRNDWGNELILSLQYYDVMCIDMYYKKSRQLFLIYVTVPNENPEVVELIFSKFKKGFDLAELNVRDSSFDGFDRKTLIFTSPPESLIENLEKSFPEEGE